MFPEFIPFQKIPRLSRNIIITEKIDGPNAQICILEDGRVFAGSRTRWITPEKDNYGFAKWVKEHESELLGLGIGRHYGEWWGNGIRRGYGLTEKRFSLFNTGRWIDDVRPNCCGVVPVLYQGLFSQDVIDLTIGELSLWGSKAAPGFMKPEGIVIYHAAANMLFKKTIEQDSVPKGSKGVE